MGFFGRLKSTYKKSEAAVVVQNLLELQAKVGLFDLDPAEAATKLVESVWNTKPDVFDGKFGQRPHKITVAAAALANGIESFRKEDMNRNALVLSLGNIMSEVETNGTLYPLNSLDHELLTACGTMFLELAQEFGASSEADEIATLVGITSPQSWEEWFAIFKIAAGQYNSQLEVDAEGRSLIDFMQLEPLRRAFKDGVDPKSLAKDFAGQFDIAAFGRPKP